MVVRLNKKQYDKERFTKHGIKHMELYFTDGSCPEDTIVEDFLAAVEKEKGAVAVHCKVFSKPECSYHRLDSEELAVLLQCTL